MYNKITKAQARKAWNNGEAFGMLPSKCYPNNPWLHIFWIDKSLYEEMEEYDWTFDKVVNEYSYYNCNKALGTSIAFFIKT